MIASSCTISKLSQHSHKPKTHKPRSPLSTHGDSDDDAELTCTFQAKNTQRSHGPSPGKRNPPAPEQPSETTTAEVGVLKAELAKARADASAAVALVAGRESS